MRPIVVTDAAAARAADAAAIAAGIPSRALMQRAGAAAATEIAFRYPHLLSGGVVVATGPGNNGGDGWVVARALHDVGIRVRVVECAPARTPDALAERKLAVDAGVAVDTDVRSISGSSEPILVDAVLGTGITADRPLEGTVGAGVGCLQGRISHGATVIALDVPSGLDASTGAPGGAPRCALTLTFGSLKRGHLVARDLCGTLVVLDIGLGAHAQLAGGMHLATDDWFHATLPAIEADAHKGTRGKVAIVGGGAGMAGAAILAARGAARSGAGMVKCVVARESLLALQESEPSALSASWEEMDDAVQGWADVLLIGPGLGSTARAIVERALRSFAGPVVLDADALNAFAGDAGALRELLDGRPALLTPHPAEFARLAGSTVKDTLARRFDAPRALAVHTGATVLLKGVPTVIASPDGGTMVVAEGTPVLATGGSGDVLGGIAATLLAQVASPLHAGALAAFAHGRAALGVSERQVRGHTLDEVLARLPLVWGATPPSRRPPVLYELPAVGEPV